MQRAKKKGSATQKRKSPDPLGSGYWDAPPEVPIHNIRNMLTSLEKELELLNGANEVKRRKLEEQMMNTRTLAHPIINIAPSPLGLSNPQRLLTLAPDDNKKSSRLAQNMNHPVAPVRKTSSSVRYTTYSFDRYKRYKTRILLAYQARKIFTIHGSYPELREALRSRGWIEKLPLGSYKNLQNLSQHNLLASAKSNNDFEIVVMSKMLENHPAYFIWQPKNHYDYFQYVQPYRNRIRLRRALDFTTKEGLVTCVNRAMEFGGQGSECTIHPRTYKLSHSAEIENFVLDYKLTRCLGFLLFLSEKSNLEDIFDSSGEVDKFCLNFALSRAEKAIALKKGQPSDIAALTSVGKDEWTRFFTDSDKIINQNMKIFWNSSNENNMEKVKNMVEEILKQWPRFRMDGYENVWILKPSDYCRGYGIMLMNDFNAILNHAKAHPKLRYIAQKYIERPLLIYKTKFDIRQYVLVVITDVITIYLYKNCYVKFSSQEFDLKRLHESVHVTNFAVQSKYKNGTRNELLPPHNMWSLSELQNYFKSINKDNVWDEFIFPRIQDMVISVMMASFESAHLVLNAFELYGIDLMLTENFEPVLIEINATPDLTHSTCVTARICPETVRDLVKVVVDLPQNPKANIGNFKPVYTVGWSKGLNNKTLIQETAKELSPIQKQKPTMAKRLPLKGKKIRTSRQQNILKNPVPTKSKPDDSATSSAIKNCNEEPTNMQTNKKEKSNPNQDNKALTETTNTFINQITRSLNNLGAPAKNTSKKDAIANQVLRVIDALYNANQKSDVKPPPQKLLPAESNILKLGKSKEGSKTTRRKNQKI